jgi:hypothetical protein
VNFHVSLFEPPTSFAVRICISNFEHLHLLQLVENMWDRNTNAGVDDRLLVPLTGLLDLQRLNSGWCTLVGDDDMLAVATLTKLADLELARSQVIESTFNGAFTGCPPHQSIEKICTSRPLQVQK